MKISRHTPFEMRFAHQVKKGDGCWEWRGAKNGGYGIICFEGKSRRATHAAWYLAHGEWPSDALVCHKCDNPSCVNPEHLFLGTAKENNRDAIAKGRRGGWPRPSRKGEANGRAKLTEAHVAEIIAAQDSADELAARFNVGKSTIYRIKRGERQQAEGMTP